MGRTLHKDSAWNTLFLPFSLTAEQIAVSPLAGAVIMTLDESAFNEATRELTINFAPAVSIEAGKPYIVKWTEGTDIENPVFNNVTINNCTASGTMMHSLAQLTGTTGGTITNCTVTGSESFVNVSGGTGDFTISGNTFTSDENASAGYGIRENGSSTAVITLTDNNFTAANAVLLGKTTAVTAGTINVESGIYTGSISKTEAATGKIVVSGGYFSEEVVQDFHTTG